MKLDPEDYLEPRCPLSPPHHHHGGSCTCHDPNHHHHEQAPQIPLDDVIKECDRLFNKEDMPALGEHLRHWRSEAQKIGDRRGELSILSEMMGYYRMTGDAERGLPAVRDGFALLSELGIGGTVSAGTILLNGATALKSFGFADEALTHYAEAFRCYGRHLDPGDWRFAGLLNNMAAAYLDKGDVRYAEVYYRKALDVLQKCHNLMDSAVTRVNLAQLYHSLDPEDERIEKELDLALECFNDPAAKRDGYYAHTCRKVASAFGYLGFFRDEAELNRRADLIYASH